MENDFGIKKQRAIYVVPSVIYNSEWL